MVADADAFDGASLADERGHARAGEPAFTVLVVCEAGGPSEDLLRCLEDEGVAYTLAGDASADVRLLDLTEAERGSVEGLSKREAGGRLPAIAAISWEHLGAPDLRIHTKDVIVVPWRLGELSLRIRRIQAAREPADAPGVIRAGDLVIDTNRYDVYLAGRPVLLTFKEYELLKLLAGNPGRVYNREALLEQVWGYHYFGGTRTVDVHVRRLRSKIEDATHTFIDTVWNVGYRFHADQERHTGRAQAQPQA